MDAPLILALKGYTDNVASRLARRLEGPLLEKVPPMVQDGLHLSDNIVAKKGAAGSSVEGRIAVTPPHVIRRYRSPAERPSGDALVGLRTELKMGLRDELAALRKLTTLQQQQFRDLARLVAFRADGRLALRQLLLEGRLTAPSRFVDNRDLLTQLYLVRDQPLAAGVNRKTYLAEVLQEIQDFRRVNQEEKGTCAATTARTMLIQFDAAEYMRMQRSLISPRGVALLRDVSGEVTGDSKRVLKRKPDWNLADDGGRTIAARVQDPAAMQYAYEVHSQRYVYDNGLDTKTVRWGSDKDLDGGLFDHEFRHLLKGYFPGSSWDSVVLPNRKGTKAAQNLLVKVGRLADPASPIPVGVDYPQTGYTDGGPHQVAVIGVTTDKVRYYNPIGRLESMKKKKFTEILLDAVLPVAM